MGIIRSKRVFLDSWVLKNLSRESYASQLSRIRSLVESGEIRLIVTGDHLEDFAVGGFQKSALKEAAVIDSLYPLWMPIGMGIYHREAYSEYLRLKGSQPLPPPYPSENGSLAHAQWFCDCPCQKGVADLARLLANNDRDPTLSGKLQSAHRMDNMQLRPMTKDLLDRKKEFNLNREWASEKNVNWDKHFRLKWIQYLTEFPAVPPPEDIVSLADRIDLSRMPAWAVWMGVERQWHRNKDHKTKDSDLVDIMHLAVLPYVDVFVTEKHLADLIEKARIKTPCGRVHRNLDGWLAELR